MRPEIEQFAEEMEEFMQKHGAEKGDSWKLMPLHDLVNGLLREVDEFHYAESNYDAMKECVDIANFCMMLWHRYKQEASK